MFHVKYTISSLTQVISIKEYIWYSWKERISTIRTEVSQINVSTLSFDIFSKYSYTALVKFFSSYSHFWNSPFCFSDCYPFPNLTRGGKRINGFIWNNSTDKSRFDLWGTKILVWTVYTRFDLNLCSMICKIRSNVSIDHHKYMIYFAIDKVSMRKNV